MAYDIQLASGVRDYLLKTSDLKIEEKKMFGGLTFMVNQKMCINVSGENQMCRFDSKLLSEISKKTGYVPMVMKGRTLKGYCYVRPNGFKHDKDFEYWLKLCLKFNQHAKASAKSK
jgi:TfoX/Sxy family transcriptional regulator of competence genes